MCPSYTKWVYRGELVNLYRGIDRFDEGTSSNPFHEETSCDPFHIEGTSNNTFFEDNEMVGMLHDIEALIENEEETLKEGLENEILFNSCIEEEMTNIFQELLNQARRELYLDYLEVSSLNFLVMLMHVKYEAKATSPTNYIWMYPIKRNPRTLKQYVQNKARLEGSIAEAYVMNESSTMSNFPTGFDESDSLFDFNDKKFNNVGGTRWNHSRNLELDRYVAQNGKIPIFITLGQNKSISPHAIRLSTTIYLLTWDTFPVCFLKWTDVTLEYIELVKGDLQFQHLLDLLSIKCSHAGRSSGSRTTAILRKVIIDEQGCYSEAALQRSQLIDHVKLFKETHARGYSKGLAWGPKPKYQYSVVSSSSTFHEREMAHAREVNELKASSGS
ncbi:(R)-mandelonitrile lyase 1-like [Cucumis melo var. makuwa]|uniref:(R)-mandelonitrile lyase 1-like n=1 Tax=Cucumis melo var. makuwa TaxID=1194695 RepID=A0A5A7SJM6_CUCMM|nr:(R)-mandelonitrile lyase 1-like [Cucumis melo var. makuwa]